MTLARNTLRCGALTFWLASLASVGCYTYVPATWETIPVGSHLQAVMSTEGQIVLRNRIGVDDPLLKGELLENSGETVLLSVRTTGISDQFGMREALHQRVDVPKSHILRVDQRRLDAFRTGSFVAAAAGGTVVIVLGALDKKDPGGIQPNGPVGPDDNLISWSIPLPLSGR